MFKIERQIKEARESRERDGGVLTPAEVVQWRRERSAPILTAFKAWADDLLLGTTPQSALGKALAYTARQWPKLVLHLEHGEVPIHNNAVENEIRPLFPGAPGLALCQQPARRTRQRQFILTRGQRARQWP